MKLPTWLEVILGVAVLLAGWSWLRAHEALRDALAQKDVLVEQMHDLQGRINAAGLAEQKANQQLEAARNKPATVQTVTQYIPLPGQIKIQQDPGQPPQLVVVGDSQQNLNALQAFGIECQQCKNSLAARNQQYADLQKQLALSEQNAKNWEKAAGHKTGFWAHTKEWGIRLAFAGGGYIAGRKGHIN